MIVLRIVGIVLAIVLALGVAPTVLTLCLPARIEVRRRPPDGPLRVRIGFGPVKRVWTPGRARRIRPGRKRPEKPQKDKPQASRAPLVDLERLDIPQALSLAMDLIDDMAGTMTWQRLHVALVLHTSDAARTGGLLGALSAAVGNLYPYLQRAFVLEDIRIVIDADFDAARTVWGVDLAVMTRLGRFPRILWRRRRALRQLWKSIRTTKEQRAQWAAEHAAAQAE